MRAMTKNLLCRYHMGRSEDSLFYHQGCLKYMLEQGLVLAEGLRLLLSELSGGQW